VPPTAFAIASVTPLFKESTHVRFGLAIDAEAVRDYAEGDEKSINGG
jgi:hypothetical protein